MWVGLIEPIEQNIWVRGNSSCLTTEPRHESLPAFRHNLKNQFFLVLSLLAFGLDPSHQLSWLSGLQTWTGTTQGASSGLPAYQLQVLRLLRLCNCWVSSLYSIPLSIISYWFCFSEELWVIQRVRRKLLFPEPVDNRNWAGCSIFIISSISQNCPLRVGVISSLQMRTWKVRELKQQNQVTWLANSKTGLKSHSL